MGTTHKLGGHWGDAITYFDRDITSYTDPASTYRLVGWKQKRPEVGDLVEVQGHISKWTLRMVKVDYQSDPNDMFFADAVVDRVVSISGRVQYDRNAKTEVAA